MGFFEGLIASFMCLFISLLTPIANTIAVASGVSQADFDSALQLVLAAVGCV